MIWQTIAALALAWMYTRNKHVSEAAKPVSRLLHENRTDMKGNYVASVFKGPDRKFRDLTRHRQSRLPNTKSRPIAANVNYTPDLYHKNSTVNRDPFFELVARDPFYMEKYLRLRDENKGRKQHRFIDPSKHWKPNRLVRSSWLTAPNYGSYYGYTQRAEVVIRPSQ